MTLFPFCLLSKKTKQAWFQKYAERLEGEFRSSIESIQADHERSLKEREDSLKRKEFDLEDLIQRIDDRRLELESKKNELREQIRLIEAKASPDSVWVEAFGSGFSKAWDMIEPLMTEGVHKMKGTIRDRAIDETLKGLESHIVSRIESAGQLQLKASNEVIAKKENLLTRIAASQSAEEKLQLSHYLEALDWIVK